MKKSILKLLIVITIISLLLLFFAGCKSPGITELEERIEKLELEEKIKELEDELAKKEAEEASPEEEGESPASDTDIDNDEIGEEPTEEEEPSEEGEAGDEETDADSSTDSDKEPPTISLAIYEGPTLDGSICYYRVEATVTGSPTVSFSKDDSGGAWGSKKVQININNPGDTYTLTATASNSEGSDTDSITLNWGCAIPTPDPIVKNVFISADVNLSGWIAVGSAAWHNFNIAYVGDSTLDTFLEAYLSFDIDDLGDINGIIIKNVSLSIPIDKIDGHPAFWAGSTINISVIDYGPSLDLGDQNLGSWRYYLTYYV